MRPDRPVRPALGRPRRVGPGWIGWRWCGLAALVLMVGGCASGGAKQPAYLTHYQAGRYQLALASARASAGQPGGVSEAALVAGLAAEAMRDDATARLWLQPIAQGRGELAVRASAGLALIDLRTGNPLRAAEALEAASTRLTGHDAREAARVAAEAYELAQRPADAERMRRRALGILPEPSTALAGGGEPSPARPGVGGYTLQVGAFSTRSAANQRVAQVRSRAQTAGLGEPSVELVVRDGRPLYVVRIGRFATEADAQRALRMLGVEAIVSGAG